MGGEERLLRRVLRVVRVTQQPPTEPDDQVPVAAEELFGPRASRLQIEAAR